MLLFVVIGFFAAFGALCMLWVLLGVWLLNPSGSQIILFPPPGREERVVHRYLWLRSLGLVKGKVTVVSQEPFALQENYPGVLFLTWGQFLSELDQEREKLYGA